MSALLELRRLEVRYGSVPGRARNLTLEVGEGEIVGLIGPNGAGKSTTLHAIMGLVPAHTRRDRLPRRRRSASRSPEAVARSGIALVPGGAADLPAT